MSGDTKKTWYVECGASLPNERFTRNHLMSAEDVNKFRFKFNNTGVFETAYKYDSNNQEEALLDGDFYIDFDNDLDSEDAFLQIKKNLQSALQYLNIIFKIPYEQIRLYFSGKKGFHVIVPKEVFGVQPHMKLNMIYKSMIERLVAATQIKVIKGNSTKLDPGEIRVNNQIYKTTIDLRPYDRKRLFRMINSKHQSTGLYKIPVTLDEIKTLSLGEMRDLAKEPRVIKYAAPMVIQAAVTEYRLCLTAIETRENKPKREFIDKPMDYTPPCIQSIMQPPVHKGGRNETLVLLASFFKQNGKSYDDAEILILKWNDLCLDPPLSEHEVLTSLKSVYRTNNKWGCSKARDIGHCDPKKCKLYKK